MSTLLWLLSFVLHGVLLYAVIILYTRFSALKETERQQKKILEETENTLAAFLLELKEENERLEDAKAVKRRTQKTPNPGRNRKKSLIFRTTWKSSSVQRNGLKVTKTAARIRLKNVFQNYMNKGSPRGNCQTDAERKDRNRAVFKISRQSCKGFLIVA